MATTRKPIPGDLLTHTPNQAQFRCPQCDIYGFGEELVRNNKDTLKRIVEEHS